MLVFFGGKAINSSEFMSANPPMNTLFLTSD